MKAQHGRHSIELSATLTARGREGAPLVARSGSCTTQQIIVRPHDENEIRDCVSAIVRAATTSGVGFRVVEVRTGQVDDVTAGAQSSLEQLGFVCVLVGRTLEAPETRPLLGRHVALVCGPGADAHVAATWIRRLGRASPRGHALVVLRGAEDRTAPHAPELARERLLAYEEEIPLVRSKRHAPPAWLDRAEVCRRRGRLAAARRWFLAAAAAAARRGDEPAASEAGCRLVDLLIDQGDPREAVRIGFALADQLKSWAPRVDLIASTVAALLADCQLDRAEALMASVLAEAHVLGESLPVAIDVRRAELAFWRGRFGRVDNPAGIRSVDVVGWHGLSAWARGDGSTLAEACRAVEVIPPESPNGSVARFWSAALGALLHDPQTRDSGFAARVLHFAADAPRRLGALARAIAADVLLTRGRVEDARGALGQPQPDGCRLDELLLAWLRERCARDEPAATAHHVRARDVRRVGAHGILRWGEGKRSMHLVHGLPSLLQLVQDADDDLAALVGGCAWVRRHAGADAVAIVEADGSRVIANDGWAVADLAQPDGAVVVAPVRAGRVLIGQVLARGPDADRPAIEQASLTLAALMAPALRSRLDAMAIARDAHRVAPEILGTSPGIVAVREAIARAAGTRFPVLVEGESGTGKELVARALHRLSPRRDRPFAAVNCAALTDDLMEAELFGHARGAFTGALGARTGLFESAHGGTLFLDEVSELSHRGQAKLLRALQEGEVRRVGENTARAVDVRVVAATNAALAEAAADGSFRQDLLFRLAVVRIRLPPLRERVEDIPLLAYAFWRRLSADRGHRAVLGPEAIAAFCRHDWPGNIRELQNVIAGLVVAAPLSGRVTRRHVQHVLASAAPDGGGVSLTAARALAERRAVADALARHGGRRSAAATELGLSRQGLTKALRRLGLAGVDRDTGVA